MRQKASASSARERIDVRLNGQAKAVLQEAALLTSCSLTDFVLAASLKLAHETIMETRLLKLASEEAVSFIEALAEKPTVIPALRRAFALHSENNE